MAARIHGRPTETGIAVPNIAVERPSRSMDSRMNGRHAEGHDLFGCTRCNFIAGLFISGIGFGLFVNFIGFDLSSFSSQRTNRDSDTELKVRDIHSTVKDIQLRLKEQSELSTLMEKHLSLRAGNKNPESSHDDGQERGYEDRPVQKQATQAKEPEQLCESFRGTFVDNMGEKFPGKVAAQLQSNLFVFYQEFEDYVKMAAIDAQGHNIEGRFFDKALCSPAYDECVLLHWVKAHRNVYKAEQVERLTVPCKGDKDRKIDLATHRIAAVEATLSQYTDPWKFTPLERLPFDFMAQKLVEETPSGGLVSNNRKLLTVQLTMRVLIEDIPGDIVETGVFNGGTAILMAKVLETYAPPDRLLWAADSFKGLPKDDEEALNADQSNPLHSTIGNRVADWRGEEGEFSSARSVFEDNIKSHGLQNATRIKILEGFFIDTLPGAPIKTISFLRLDGDIFISTKQPLEILYEKVSIGGFIYVDDYGTYKGCRMAVDQYRKDNAIYDPMIPVFENPQGEYEAVWWQKRTSVKHTEKISTENIGGAAEKIEKSPQGTPVEDTGGFGV